MNQPLRTDGLPTLPNGEPVMHRWFVLAMAVLVPVTLAVFVAALMLIGRDTVDAAERRPAGDGHVTVDRGHAQLAQTLGVAVGPDCMQAIRLIGDDGSRAAAKAAAMATCRLLDDPMYALAREGLAVWSRSNGQLRYGTFELSGVESSARVEDGRIVIELNAKFQFVAGVHAAPALLHQLALITDPAWPGQTVGASRARDGARLEQAACKQLVLDAPPRGCSDVDELLSDPDVLSALVAAGYRDDR